MKIITAQCTGSTVSPLVCRGQNLAILLSIKSLKPSNAIRKEAHYETPAFRDPLPELLDQWRQARKDWRAAELLDSSGNSSSAECNAALERESVARDRITGTRAFTREGVQAQVQFLIEDEWDNLKAEYGETFLASLRGDFQCMAEPA